MEGINQHNHTNKRQSMSKADKKHRAIFTMEQEKKPNKTQVQLIGFHGDT